MDFPYQTFVISRPNDSLSFRELTTAEEFTIGKQFTTAEEFTIGKQWKAIYN
jgi:hypothetical protein